MDLGFLGKLHSILPAENVRIKEPLSRHTTFQIGGPADYFAAPQTLQEFVQAILLCREHAVPYKVIGNGSNLLFSDQGFCGLVLKNAVKQEAVLEAGASGGAVNVTVCSSLPLSKFARLLYENSLAGYEFAAGIPGTVGGALVMNAGAYGGEIGDYVHRVEVLDEKGGIRSLYKDDLSFSYRHSILRQAGLIVLQAVFSVPEGIQTEILSKMESYRLERKKKQPLEYPSAGSAFKRPEGAYAGKLIMEAGLSGYSVGGAKVSEKHCGFVVNTGNACADDVKKLLYDVQAAVKRHSGHDLEIEIEIQG